MGNMSEYQQFLLWKQAQADKEKMTQEQQKKEETTKPPQGNSPEDMMPEEAKTDQESWFYWKGKWHKRGQGHFRGQSNSKVKKNFKRTSKFLEKKQKQQQSLPANLIQNRFE